MTQTLTEQWHDGTLPRGEYYIKLDDGSLTTDRYYGKCFGFSAEIPVEVLSAVPSYDELQTYEKCVDMLIDVNKKWEKTIKERKQLEKKLAIATKALEEYADPTDWFGTTLNNSVGYYEKAFFEDNGYEIAQKALKEMESVK